MTRLNATAKAALKNYGVSQAEWGAPQLHGRPVAW